MRFVSKREEIEVIPLQLVRFQYLLQDLLIFFVIFLSSKLFLFVLFFFSLAYAFC